MFTKKAYAAYAALKSLKIFFPCLFESQGSCILKNVSQCRVITLEDTILPVEQLQ